MRNIDILIFIHHFFKDKISLFFFLFLTLFTFCSCAFLENIVTSELFTVVSVFVLIHKLFFMLFGVSPSKQEISQVWFFSSFHRSHSLDTFRPWRKSLWLAICSQGYFIFKTCIQCLVYVCWCNCYKLNCKRTAFFFCRKTGIQMKCLHVVSI